MEEDPNKKAELAFDIIDKSGDDPSETAHTSLFRDKDGFISKQEFLDLSDKITQKQVSGTFSTLLAKNIQMIIL